jgi:hypothetical protein
MDVGDGIYFGVLGVGLIMLILTGAGLYRDRAVGREWWGIPAIAATVFAAVTVVLTWNSGSWFLGLAVGAMAGVLAGHAYVGGVCMRLWVRRQRRKRERTGPEHS